MKLNVGDKVWVRAEVIGFARDRVLLKLDGKPSPTMVKPSAIGTTTDKTPATRIDTVHEWVADKLEHARDEATSGLAGTAWTLGKVEAYSAVLRYLDTWLRSGR